MRGKKAKAMRRYTRERFPFLSQEAIYRLGEYGTQTVVLAEQCQRAVYQKIKRSYKISRIHNTTIWRDYNERTQYINPA
jgi:hypothetical protein